MPRAIMFGEEAQKFVHGPIRRLAGFPIYLAAAEGMFRTRAQSEQGRRLKFQRRQYKIDCRRIFDFSMKSSVFNTNLASLFLNNREVGIVKILFMMLYWRPFNSMGCNKQKREHSGGFH